ncbi:MAG: hypothetical protein EHM80_14500 [Nitrospiraceae bacterium]|nr:MAG: hypothetical protein EHM80_14500 [Nitrospiraceae bacterium]
MFNFDDPEVFWLITTNAILGLVVLACVVIVGGAIFQEVRDRIMHRFTVPATEKQAILFPFVGTTMADGGELITAKARQTTNARPADTDRSHASLSAT